MEWIGVGVTIGGASLLAVAGVGVARLPDALSRQHAATKSGTLALGLILLGVALAARDWAWALRVMTIEVLLLVTLPVASHMLARAAARHAYTSEQLRHAPRVDDAGVDDAGADDGNAARR